MSSWARDSVCLPRRAVATSPKPPSASEPGQIISNTIIRQQTHKIKHHHPVHAARQTFNDVLLRLHPSSNLLGSLTPPQHAAPIHPSSGSSFRTPSRRLTQSGTPAAPIPCDDKPSFYRHRELSSETISLLRKLNRKTQLLADDVATFLTLACPCHSNLPALPHRTDVASAFGVGREKRWVVVSVGLQHQARTRGQSTLWVVGRGPTRRNAVADETPRFISVFTRALGLRLQLSRVVRLRSCPSPFSASQ